MKITFSKSGLWQILFIVGSLTSIYLLFIIVPYLSPIWRLVQTVSVPFVISVIIAYLLHPLVNRITRLGISRTLSVALLYLILFGGILLASWYAMPLLVRQVKSIFEQLPEIEHLLLRWFWWINQHIEQLPDGVHHGIDDALGNLEKEVRQFMSQLIHSLKGLIGSFFVLIVVPFLVFYILNDMKLIKKGLHRIIPHQHRKKALRIWRDIDHALGEYIRGQIIISLCVGGLVFLGYWMIGLPYALSLAIVAMVTNLIPYFGPFLGAVPALLLAIITAPSLAIWVIVINTVIQVIEGNLLSPWIMGRRLHIHPVYIIFALLIGEEMGGILGLLFAVPVFVILRVIVLNIHQHTKKDHQSCG